MLRRSSLVCAVAMVLAVPAQPALGQVGGARPAQFTVFAFSQSDVGEPGDPQVYRLAPDINIRAIGKWSTNGDEATDYDFAQIRLYHQKGISFMGSGTASVIFPQDFA